MLGFFTKKIFGTRNDRILKGLRPFVSHVNELEAHYEKMSNEDLKSQTAIFKEKLNQGATLDDIQSAAFAVVREAAKRTLGQRHYDVQLIGGAVLHQGKIAEMKTGEGKTLVATLPAYLNALTEKGVHIVTVNDYLAKRDAEWMAQVYNFLNLSVGVVHHGQNHATKLKAYHSDITYGQNNEFGFDYLRDNMKYSSREMLQKRHAYAIVDEVDSILIDEARTPLIISGPTEDSTDKYQLINKIIPKLKNTEHYDVDLKSKNPTLNEAGVAKAEDLLNIDNLFDPKNIEILHHVNQALKAHTTLVRDVDYVINDGKVVIVDEFTGRLMPGRRWSDGLHQAVEAKEGLQIATENQTLASITFQNFFRMYEKLAGMTGTADTEAVEFMQIYNLEVVVIPTNKPMARQDLSDKVYRSPEEKYNAVVEDIQEITETGQPILVGTVSIEQSENLSKQLKKAGIEHQVLNAKHHETEAEIVAQAGRFGAVTISTNMAGRGTDIMLGGNPSFLAAKETGTREINDPTYQEAFKKYQQECNQEKASVLEAGGLYIIGTERHESRRIDNQLRGRAGRQGDPGKTSFYISLGDDLMRRFGGERLQNIMNKLGWEEGAAIDGRIISRTIENAQERVEQFHFEARKHVTEYDDVMNKQRQVIYNLRNTVLTNEGIREEVYSFIDDLVEETVLSVCQDNIKPADWNIESLSERVSFLFNQSSILNDDIELDQQKIFDLIRDKAKSLYDERVIKLQDKLNALKSVLESEDLETDNSEGNPFQIETIERNTILETIDHFWNLHLKEMDYLREGIGLRGYGQQNPLHAYQKEGFLLFQQMIDNLRESVVRKLFYFDVQEKEELISQIEEEKARREQKSKQMELHHDSALDSNDDQRSAAPVDPDSAKKKLAEQRKARRKKRR